MSLMTNCKQGCSVSCKTLSVTIRDNIVFFLENSILSFTMLLKAVVMLKEWDFDKVVEVVCCILRGIIFEGHEAYIALAFSRDRC